MENASKALLIAGSILIAIIIISLGIMVFRNMAGSVQNNSSLDREVITAFNAKLNPYIGKSVSSSQVNVLIQLVRSINQKAVKDNDPLKSVTINYNGESIGVKSDGSAIDGTLTRVPSGSYYEVSASYGSSGLINIINIQ